MLRHGSSLVDVRGRRLPEEGERGKPCGETPLRAGEALLAGIAGLDPASGADFPSPLAG
jgi:hypothetical protein